MAPECNNTTSIPSFWNSIQDCSSLDLDSIFGLDYKISAFVIFCLAYSGLIDFKASQTESPHGKALFYSKVLDIPSLYSFPHEPYDSILTHGNDTTKHHRLVY